MHVAVLIISDERPDDDADLFTNQDEVDYVHWVGDEAFGYDDSWTDRLKAYLLTKNADENVDDIQFGERYGEKGLRAAPRISRVDFRRLLQDEEASFVGIGGSLQKRRGWCLAHQKMEEDPTFVEDTLESVSAYLKQFDVDPDRARMWLYGAHI
jgi:hypothetical protein